MKKENLTTIISDVGNVIYKERYDLVVKNIFVLSNSCPENETRFEIDKFYLKPNDKVYLSHKTKKKKPDAEAYAQILDENKINPDECIFIEDKIEILMLLTTNSRYGGLFTRITGSLAET